MTIACLKGFGKMPFLRDKLTSFVNKGRRMSMHCFTICVGHGTREQFFERASLINFRTLLSVTWKGTESWRPLIRVKKLRLGVFEGVSDLFNFINEKQTKSVCY